MVDSTWGWRTFVFVVIGASKTATVKLVPRSDFAEPGEVSERCLPEMSRTASMFLRLRLPFFWGQVGWLLRFLFWYSGGVGSLFLGLEIDTWESTSIWDCINMIGRCVGWKKTWLSQFRSSLGDILVVATNVDPVITSFCLVSEARCHTWWIAFRESKHSIGKSTVWSLVIFAMGILETFPLLTMLGLPKGIQLDVSFPNLPRQCSIGFKYQSGKLT